MPHEFIPDPATWATHGYEVLPEDFERIAANTERIVLESLSRNLDRSSRMDFLEWVEEYYPLSDGGPIKGKYRFSNVPYLRGIADAMQSTKPEERVVLVQKGVQLGMTELGVAYIGYSIDQEPTSVLFYMDTEQKVRAFMKDRVRNMIVNGPFPYLAKMGGTSGEASLDQINFPGGSLYARGGQSPTQFSSITAGKVILDEYARMKKEQKKDGANEGTPIGLALGRMSAYGDRGKMYVPSSPTDSEDVPGSFTGEVLKGDCRQYFMPCPHCKESNYLRHENLEYKAKENGLVTDAWFKCPSCSGKIHEDKHKQRMLKMGEWRPTRERSNRSYTSFIAPSFIARYGAISWVNIAQAYEEAKRGTREMSEVFNTMFGLPYSEAFERPPVEIIQQNCGYAQKTTAEGERLVPNDSVFLTAAVDVQGDWVEWEVKAYTFGMRSYSIDTGKLMGKMGTEVLEAQLRTVLLKERTYESGEVMGAPRVVCVDSKHLTDEVLKFCAKFDQPAFKGERLWKLPSKTVVVPIETSNVREPDRIIMTFSNNKKQHGSMHRKDYRTWKLGSIITKLQLYRSFEEPRDSVVANMCRFPDDYPQSYWEGLRCEVVHKKNGITVFENPKGARNEPIDLNAYNRAAAEIVVGAERVDMDKLARSRGLVPNKERTHYVFPDEETEMEEKKEAKSPEVEKKPGQRTVKKREIDSETGKPVRRKATGLRKDLAEYRN